MMSGDHDVTQVSREQLYEQVWTEPMTKVAARYQVCSNYLARVCAHLNVPAPPRGYWAKQRVGKAPNRPPLPPARPGEVLEWARGDSVPRPARPPRGEPKQTTSAARKEQPVRHALVTGVREDFEAGRLSETGYLRPLKRNLVDVLVTQSSLGYALDTANRLFLVLEARGHRVVLDPGFRRPELKVYPGQQFDYYRGEPWRPGRQTIVFIGDVAIGLSIYEATEETEVRYEWNQPIRYIRVSEAPPKRRPRWMDAERTQRQQMPSGRLGVRAYAPYPGVEWEQRWQEDRVGGLSNKTATIVRELEAVAPRIRERQDVALIRSR
jgi:hypothetical protein